MLPSSYFSSVCSMPVDNSSRSLSLPRRGLRLSSMLKIDDALIVCCVGGLPFTLSLETISIFRIYSDGKKKLCHCATVRLGNLEEDIV